MKPINNTAQNAAVKAATGRGLGSRLVANTAANFVGQTLLMVLVFFATPYIIHRLGSELYGLLVLLLAYVQFFTLLELGINLSLVKYLAEMLPQQRLEEANGYFGTALALFAVVGASIAGLMALSAPWIVAHLLNISPQLQPLAVFGLRVASASFFCEFISQPFSAVPLAAQRFDVVNAVNVGSEAVRLGTAVAVLYVGYLFEGVMLAVLLASLIRVAGYTQAAQRLVPQLSFWPRFSWPHFLSIFHFSKFVLIARISGQAVHSLDKVIVGHFLPVAFVAFYAVPYKLGERLSGLVGNITSVVFPAASELSASDSRQRLRELYLRGSKMAAAAAALPALALCLYSRELLLYWIGPEFAEQGTWALRLLSLGFLANCLAHVPYATSQAIGRPRIAARFAAMNAVMNLVLLFLLVPKFGVVGAAAGFLVAQLILSPVFIHTLNRELQVGWSTLLRQSYFPVVLGCAAGSLVLAAGKPWVSSLLSLGLVVGAGLATYAGLASILILDAKERASCRAVLDAWRPFRYLRRETSHV